MNNILRKTRDFILTQQTGIISSTVVIASMLLLARFFGFLQSRILNSYFTAGQLDTYYAAFRIPDFVFELLITGALTTTFIPFYLKYARNPEKQNELVVSILNIILIALVIAIALLTMLISPLLHLLAPGFDPQKLDTVTRLAQMLLIGQMPFMVLGNFFMGISQARKSFLLPAIAPVLYSISVVVATILFAPVYGMMAVVVGIMCGSVIFLLTQMLILSKVKIEYLPKITHVKETIQFFRTSVPRMFTVFMAQIEVSVDMSLASMLVQGSYTIFNYAQRLQFLPVSILGMAFGQASLPYISEMYENNKISELRTVIVDSINNLFFITIPFAGFFIVMRTPLVRLIYGGAKFDWNATVLTAVTMSYFCFSLPFHSAYYFLTRCFYAVSDSKTPFIVSIISILFNTISSYVVIAIYHQPVWALGVTFSITITIQVIILFIIFYHRIKGLNLIVIIKELAKVAIAGGLATIITFDARRVLDGLIFDTSRTLNLFSLTLTCFLIMIVTYVFACWTLDSRGLYLVGRAVLHLKRIRQQVVELFVGVQT